MDVGVVCSKGPQVGVEPTVTAEHSQPQYMEMYALPTELTRPLLQHNQLIAKHLMFILLGVPCLKKMFSYDFKHKKGQSKSNTL